MAYRSVPAPTSLLRGTTTILAMAALAACSSSHRDTPDQYPPSGPVTSTPQPTPSPAALAALTAAQAYWDFGQASAEDPDKYTQENRFEDVAMGDAEEGLRQDLSILQQRGLLFRGGTDAARLHVTSDRSMYSPPTVTVTNCPLRSASREIFDRRANQALAEQPPASGEAPPPNLYTYTLHQLSPGQWRVEVATLDVRHTCAG